MFHFIGYGSPEISEKGIPLPPFNDESYNHLSYDTLFNLAHPPSCFIFDCNNAAICLKYLEKSSKTYVPTSISQFNPDNRLVQNDWFCFCTTDIGEDLPLNPYLPKDFLSMCLLTPVPGSWLQCR